MKRHSIVMSLCGALLLALGPRAAGEDQPSNLTLGNFFTEGWDQAWQMRPRLDAPDMALLRVQSNIIVRVLRTDYYYQRPLESSDDRSVQFLGQLVEYSFNRRFMLAVFGNYQWVDRWLGESQEGATGGAMARFQLVDTPRNSYALNLRVTAPNDGLDEKLTLASVALGGWHDLTPLGLKRVGLYWHVQEETFIGPHKPGAKRNDLTYALSLAKTWTRADAMLGNLTTFVEGYAKTDLDGPRRGKSVVTITPAFRFTLARQHTLMCGLDLPLNEPRPYDKLFRITYIYSF